MPRHGVRRGGRIAPAARFENLLMGRQHVLPVAEGVAHAVMLAVRQQADRSPERLQDLVAAGARHQAVEEPVLGHEGGLVLSQRAHALDGCFHLEEVGFRAVLCGFGCKRGFDHLASLQHRGERHVVEAKVDRQAVRQRVQARTPHHEAAARAGTLLEHAERLEDADALAQGRPAHVELLQQLGLGREVLALCQAGRGHPRQQFLRDVLRLAEIGGWRGHDHSAMPVNRGGRFSSKAARPSA